MGADGEPGQGVSHAPAGEGGEGRTPTFTWGREQQELTDVVPVNTHGGHFGTAVLMELIATSLASEAIQQELLTDVTESQLQKCFPNKIVRGERYMV